MKKVLDLLCLIALVACEQGTNNAPVQVIAQIEPVAEITTPFGAAPLFPYLQN